VSEWNPATANGVLAARPAGAARAANPEIRRGPVIMLTYAHSGAMNLMQALSTSRSLACTASTGLLPLCDTAAATWQRVENRGAPASPLALQSIRTLVATMTSVLQARAGASRWCETAFVAPAAAETFLRIFPDTAFLCLHRSLRGVLAEAAAAYPWGLGGSPFWPHSAGHPGNNAETIGSYWVACTGQLLDFEAAHQSSCLRVRYEDILADPHRHVDEIFAHLGVSSGDRMASHGLLGLPGLSGQADHGREPPLPTERMSPELLAEVLELHARLDYAP
jgi:hypothetical protein